MGTERRGTDRRVGLTPEMIVDAAMELSHGRGLHAWTQRDLARRLDVAPSVLYHHVGGRAQVIRGVVERIVSTFPDPDPELPWQEWFRAVLYPCRPVLMRYPGVAKWMVMHAPSFAGSEAGFDAGVGALRRAGFPRPAMVSAALFNTAMLTIQMADDRLEQGDDGPRDHTTMLREFEPLREGSTGVAAMIDELIRPLAEGDARAETGVNEEYYRLVIESLIAGLELSLTRGSDS